MKKTLTIIFLICSNVVAFGQLPLAFQSADWKYYANTGTPQSPPNFGSINWKLQNYNTTDPSTNWPFVTKSTPFGYPGSSYTSTIFSDVYPLGYTGSKLITSYYRKSITDINLQSYSSFTLNIKRDDAIIIYLNGVEVYKDNLPPSVTHVTPANTFVGVGSSFDIDEDTSPITISGSLLASVLASASPDLTKLTITAELHQAQNPGDSAPYSSSSDAYFDIAITGVLGPVTPMITRGPYLQLPLPTSMQVRWSTNTNEIGKVCFRTSTPITSGGVTTCISESTSTSNHIINLTGLAANTKYFYSIENTTSGGTFMEGSANHFFNTPPTLVDNTKTTRIWVTGDCSQSSSTSTSSLYTPKQSLVNAGFLAFKTANSLPPADLWLLLGDNAYDDGTNEEYSSKFFDPYDGLASNIMKQTPIMPCVGNHDYYAGGSITGAGVSSSVFESNNQISGASPFTVINSSGSANSQFRFNKLNPFYDVFTMPDITIPAIATKYSTSSISGKKGFYSYNHNNIHFVCLDSYGFYNDYLLYGGVNNFPSSSSTNPQMQWLITDLNAAKIDPNVKWTIMYWHHAPYTNGGGHFSDLTVADEFILKGIRERLIKYLDESNYKIDLVLNGHSHSYERSKLLKGHHNDEAMFNPTINNNPSLIPGFNSYAASNGKYTSITTCPYIKSSSNIQNEGTIYVVTGSAGQLQVKNNAPSNIDFHLGHNAMNGAYFRPDVTIPFPADIAYPSVTVNKTIKSTIEDTKGGSFYIEVKENRLDAKFIDEDGVVGDKFTILKDAGKTTNIEVLNETLSIGSIGFPSPSLPELNTYTLNGVSTSLGLINATRPFYGAVYGIRDAFGCVVDKVTFRPKDCPAILNIENSVLGPNPISIYASNKIIATNLLYSTSNTVYQAGSSILLTPTTPGGLFFQSQNGATFTAQIGNCPF